VGQQVHVGVGASGRGMDDVLREPCVRDVDPGAVDMLRTTLGPVVDTGVRRVDLRAQPLPGLEDLAADVNLPAGRRSPDLGAVQFPEDDREAGMVVSLNQSSGTRVRWDAAPGAWAVLTRPVPAP